jgi:membrane-bound serine protease (ClpP class)
MGVTLASAQTSVRRQAETEMQQTRQYEPEQDHVPVPDNVCSPRSFEEIYDRYGMTPPTGGAGKRVVRIDVHETIDLGLAPFLKRVLDRAGQESDVALVLIHMDTPGGRLDAAQQIKDALLKSKVPTATFIDTHALSAGAFIAYATDFIIVTDGSTMGAATPINIGQKGEAQPVGEKFVSAVRAMFRATAEAKGRDGTIAEAMVDKDVEIDGIIPEGKLLTLAKREALKYCVADLEANDVSGVLAALHLENASLEHPGLNWAERIARFLTGPIVSSLLMTFGFLGLLMEFYSPGFGVTGAIGLTCLALFFGGHLVVDLVGTEEIILVLLGLVLLGAEIFVTPGFGILGSLGIASLVAGMTLAMVGADLSFSWDVGLLGGALSRAAIAAVMTLVLMALSVRLLPNAPLISRLVLKKDISEIAHDSTGQTDLVDAIGVAITPISGSGKARFDGQTMDVITEGEFIDKGVSVVVVHARAGRIVVAKREA